MADGTNAGKDDKEAGAGDAADTAPTIDGTATAVDPAVQAAADTKPATDTPKRD